MKVMILTVKVMILTTREDPDSESEDPDSEGEDPDSEGDDPDSESDDPDSESDDPDSESDDSDSESDDPDSESDDPDRESDDPDSQPRPNSHGLLSSREMKFSIRPQGAPEHKNKQNKATQEGGKAQGGLGSATLAIFWPRPSFGELHLWVTKNANFPFNQASNPKIPPAGSPI